MFCSSASESRRADPQPDEPLPWRAHIYLICSLDPTLYFTALVDTSLPTMASNGAHAAFPPEQVLEAMLTMRSNDADRKKKAHKFLEEFQKSVGWSGGFELARLEC